MLHVLPTLNAAVGEEEAAALQSPREAAIVTRPSDDVPAQQDERTGATNAAETF